MQVHKYEYLANVLQLYCHFNACLVGVQTSVHKGAIEFPSNVYVISPNMLFLTKLAINISTLTLSATAL